MKCKSKITGFTLIELMIVVLIMGILAAVALGSYSESVKKSRRAEARTVMLDAVQYMQRFYAQNNAFDKDLAGNAVTLPTELSQSPSTGTSSYAIAFASTPTASSFTLAATPQNAMSKDKCGTLQITNTNSRSLVGSDQGVTLDDCWR